MEAVSNGVPSFAKPKARNAAKTLAALGVLAVTMFAGITALAMATHVRVVENTCDLVGFAGDCRVDPQLTVIAQLAAAVSGGQTNPFFYYVQATTALVLVLAANTAFNGFPVLMSILARHDQMPRQLQNRGDRLAFSNGIIMLAAAAVLLLLVYQASVTRLIQLYILGVFTSFTLSQIGMVKHWTVELRHVVSAGVRRQLRTSRVINGVGAALTGLVLVIVLVTKFTHGAYLVVIAIPALCWWMNKVQRHYEGVRAELAVRADPRALPSRVHAVVLASQMNEPTMRAIGYARATRPSSLVAITAQVDSVHPRAPARVDGRRRAGPARGARRALPRPDRADRRLHRRHPAQRTARSRGRIHPGVRGRPLVGGDPAQPLGGLPAPAAEDAARGHDDRGALPDRVGGPAGRAGGVRRSTAGVPGQPARGSGRRRRRPGGGGGDARVDGPVTLVRRPPQ